MSAPVLGCGLETHTLSQCAYVTLSSFLKWPKSSQESQYGITSLMANQANPEKMLELVRAEWGIENKLHFRRDVTFQEDKIRMTRKPIARAMAIINNLVIALVNKQGFSNHAQARRIFCAKPSSALELVCRL